MSDEQTPDYPPVELLLPDPDAKGLIPVVLPPVAEPQS